MAVAEVKIRADGSEAKVEIEALRGQFEKLAGSAREVGIVSSSAFDDFKASLDKAVAGQPLSNLSTDFAAFQAALQNVPEAAKPVLDSFGEIDIKAGDVEHALRSQAVAVQGLVESFGFISRGQFEAQFDRIRIAMQQMRDAGVAMGPAWEASRSAMSRLKEQAVASGLYGKEALRELTRETDRSTGGFNRAGAAAAGMAPVIRTAGNIGADSVRNMLGPILQVEGALGTFGKAASTLGLKGIEESIEDMTAGMIRGARETGSLSGALSGARGGMMAAAASGFAVTAVVGALGFAVVKTAGMVREYTKAVAEAERAEMAANQATSRQEQQYDALLARLSMTKAELEKLVGGTGLGAVFAHAAKNPEGIVAQNINAMGQAAMVANEHTIRYRAALEKLGDGLRSIHPEQLKVEFEALTEVYGRSSKQLQSGLGAASLFSAEIERQINLYRQLGIAAPLALEAMHNSVVVAETRASLANIFPEDIEARTKGIMLAWGDLTGRFHSSSAAVDVLSGAFIATAAEAQRAGVVLDKYFLAQLDQARIREITRAFDDMLPPRIHDRLKALSGAHEELTRTTGSAQAATALLSGEFLKVADEAEKAGAKIGTEFLGKLNAARVEEITKAFANLTPKRVTEEALALAAAFDKLTKQVGSQKVAFQLLAPQIEDVEKKYQNLKTNMPDGLPKPFTKAAEEGRKAQESVTGLNETLAYFKERTKDVEYGNATMFGQLEVGHQMQKRLLEQAIKDTENWAAAGVAAAEKIKTAYTAVRAVIDLSGGEEGVVVKIDNTKALEEMLDKLKAVKKAADGTTKEYVSAALKAVAAGEVTTLENIVKALKEQAANIGRIPGLGNAQAADRFLGLATMLSGVLGTLKRIGTPETRDAGGPGKTGGAYIINPSAGPEAYVPTTPGTFVPNVDRVLRGGGLGGGRTEALLEQVVAGQREAAKAFRSEQILAEQRQTRDAIGRLGGAIARQPIIVRLSNNKEIARAVRDEREHNQDSLG